MRIRSDFYGPCSRELADAGVVDSDLLDFDVVVLGTGKSQYDAALNALENFRDTRFAEYAQDVSDHFVGLDLRILDEADDLTHHVFCVLRVSP